MQSAVKRPVALALLLLCSAAVVIWSWNQVAVSGPIQRALRDDARNSGIAMRAHFGSFVDSATLILDLRAVAAEKAPADVFRVLLQSAHALRNRQFETVVLAHLGKRKFILSGVYFQRIGAEYSVENPAFTMRTFPENLRRPDGSPAFGKWTGGVLGVLSKQLEDFAEFHKQWYLSDLGSSP